MAPNPGHWYIPRFRTFNAHPRYRISLLQPRRALKELIPLPKPSAQEDLHFRSIIPTINSQIRAPRIQMGCITSRPVGKIIKLNSLAVRSILWLGARLKDIFSWLKDHIPSRPVKTYPTLSEPGPHIPVEIPPVVKYLCEDQIDRYDWAYAEMSLPKSERLRRQSVLEPVTPSGVNGNLPAVDADNGLPGDHFLFL